MLLLSEKILQEQCQPQGSMVVAGYSLMRFDKDSIAEAIREY